MIKIENFQVLGWDHTIRGMRNPMNSWAKSDSYECQTQNCSTCPHWSDRDVNGSCEYWSDNFNVGPSDLDLMLRLAKAGSVDGKFRRMIAVYVDITAPLYWWKEFDTYKVGTVANSCSTMHKIHAKEFSLDDFSHEHLLNAKNCSVNETSDVNGLSCTAVGILGHVVNALNSYRELYLKTNDKKYWWQMIQLLPSSYNQKRTVMLNYEVLSNIYQHRRNHKLDEWRTLCQWIESLPYSEVITCNGVEKKEVDNLKAALAKLRAEKWSEEQISKALHGLLDADKED